MLHLVNNIEEIQDTVLIKEEEHKLSQSSEIMARSDSNNLVEHESRPFQEATNNLD